MIDVTQYPINAIADRITRVELVTPERRLSPAEIDEWCKRNPARCRKPKSKPKAVELQLFGSVHAKRRNLMDAVRAK